MHLFNSISFIGKKRCPSWHSRNLGLERIWRSKRERG